VTHPFHLTRPWYLDAELPGMAVAYLQTPAGGLIQGDRASVQITLAAQAQVHLTTQAAEKIHTMTANCALQRSTFTLAAKAYAEYYPEPVILFPGSRFAQDTHIELGTGASCFFAEVFLTPRSAEGAAFEALAATLTVQDADGTLLLRDRSLVLPARQALAGPGVLAGSHIWGQAFLLGPSVPAAWAREVSALISAEHAVIGGATVLPWGRGLGVKIVGSDMRAIRRVLATAWNYLRVRHLGVPAPQFPK
jgi:urease accessory protein